MKPRTSQIERAMFNMQGAMDSHPSLQRVLRHRDAECDVRLLFFELPDIDDRACAHGSSLPPEVSPRRAGVVVAGNDLEIATQVGAKCAVILGLAAD
jgi:hypothetical protein